MAKTAREQPKRRKRADGELSRERILDAATEIAAERGYEGTSIALVSAKCGLPASSDLLAFQGQGRLDRRGHRAQLRRLARGVAVSRRGVTARAPGGHGGADRQGAAGLAGLHPARPDAGAGAPPGRAASARDVPAGSRQTSTQLVDEHAASSSRGSADAQVDQVATYAIAGADGLFIAKEIGGDTRGSARRCSSCTPARCTTRRCA